MVEKNPEVFSLEFETHLGFEYAQAEIYKIHLEKLERSFLKQI